MSEKWEVQNDEDNESGDFLLSYRGAISDQNHDKNDDSDGKDDDNLNSDSNNGQYNPRKPKWWRQVAGKATKAQKRAMKDMQVYRLPKMEWGQHLQWKSVFSMQHHDNNNNEPEIWFEIGFGQGDNLLALAQRYPKRCFVGAEVHQPSLGKAFQRIHQAVMVTQEYWTDYEIFPGANTSCNTCNSAENLNTPVMYNNLRLHGGDGVKLLPHILSNSLAAVLVTFPDPFPKNSHQEFRVLQKRTLHEIYRVLDKSKLARLFLATDHQGHFQWCHSMVDGVNRDNQTGENSDLLLKAIPVPDRSAWLPVVSKYERKGWAEGRQTWLSCWEVLPPT